MRTLIMLIINRKGALETDSIVRRGTLPLVLIMRSTLSSRRRTLMLRRILWRILVALRGVSWWGRPIRIWRLVWSGRA